MRVSSTMLRSVAQAFSCNITEHPILISQRMLCFPRGDARQRGFRCMRVSPNAKLGSEKQQQQPAEHFLANAVLS